MQQHYLPKTYLKHFCDPGHDGKVWLYRRHCDPVLVGIANVAKERDIYTFRTPTGDDDLQVETVLSRLESKVAPILEKLNGPLDNLIVTATERASLAWFSAFLRFRTRAMRRSMIELTVRMAQDVAAMSGKEFPHADARRDPVLAKLSMIEALSHTDALAHRLGGLGIEVVRAAEIPFILPDRPVSRVEPPPTPIPGFFELFVPVGRYTFILWSTLHQPSDRPANRKLASKNVIGCNRHSLQTAVEFFIYPKFDESLAKMFSESPEPVLVTVEDV
jgi:hypothetical protein